MTINYWEQKPKKTNKQTCSNKTVDTSANCATLTFKSRHTKLPTNLVVLLLKDSNLKKKIRSRWFVFPSQCATKESDIRERTRQRQILTSGIMQKCKQRNVVTYLWPISCATWSAVWRPTSALTLPFPAPALEQIWLAMARPKNLHIWIYSMTLYSSYLPWNFYHPKTYENF